MSKSPGQSAMEYMLTYGWAILVVMVVGIVMWEIGIFNIGGSIPTTSDGFPQLKPMLATCKMSEGVWRVGNQNGFQCMFTNPLGASIKITDINVTVNGEYCKWSRVSDVPARASLSSYLQRACTSPSSCPSLPACTDWGAGDKCGCVGVGCPLIIPGESTFFVSATDNSANQWSCWIIKPGKKYEAFIDITYNISMLGETVTKHSTGHIRGSHE